jgi:hypothetical protein
MTELSPASQKLLRELAKQDKGAGVRVRYSGRDRWYLAGVSTQGLYNTRTFPSLCAAGLAEGWDEYGENPLRITEAGRKLAAALEEQSRAERAAKKARPKPSSEGAAALRLLREIARHNEPVRIFDDGLRRVWRVGSRDGHRASIGTWVAVEKAGYIQIKRVSSIGGHEVSVTDAGRKRLESR